MRLLATKLAAIASAVGSRMAAVWDSTQKGASITVAGDGLTVSSTAVGAVRSTAGKNSLNSTHYFEFTVQDTEVLVGAVYSNVTMSTLQYPGQSATSFGYYPATGQVIINGTTDTTIAQATVGAVIGVRVVFVATLEPLITIWINGTQVYTVLGPDLGGGTIHAAVGAHSAGTRTLGKANFGSTPFAYPATAPGSGWYP